MSTGDPAIFDFTWVRGTTRPFIMKFQRSGIPLDFDDVRLSVYKDSGKNLAFRASIVGTPLSMTVTDPVTGEVTFTPSAAQTRSLTKTELGEVGKNRYEVELRNGTDEEVYLIGTVAGIGGLNDDEGDPS
jgi:hypothetical protein